MVYFIDIDETICNTPLNREYSEAVPILSNIEKANKLYDRGHKIVYYTARGTESRKDFRSLTEDQFKKWGVKYHEILFGKPIYDVFIDDKALNVKDWE